MKDATREMTGPKPFLRRPLLRTIVGAAAAALVAGWWLSGPRHHVGVPPQTASPQTVVVAYFDALDARDFDTANALDDRPVTLHRYSLPGTWSDVRVLASTPQVDGTTQVLFEGVPKHIGGFESNQRTTYGLYLHKTSAGWRIVSSGVA